MMRTLFTNTIGKVLYRLHTDGSYRAFALSERLSGEPPGKIDNFAAPIRKSASFFSLIARHAL